MILLFDSSGVLPAIKRFCFGVVIGLISLWAYGLMGLWAYQPMEEGEGRESVSLAAVPEVQSYVALCKAVYWQRMREYEKAREQLETAIQLDPHSSFLYARLADVLRVLKANPAEVLSACKKSLELNPNNVDAHYSLGILMLRDRRTRQVAINEFRIVAKLKPEHLGAQYQLGSLLFGQQDYSGASEAYSEIVKLRPYDPKLRHRLGYSYMRSGETARAIREFSAAAKLDKNYPDPHFHLAYLYAGQSRNKEAIEECLAFLKYSPGEPNMNLLLAEIYVSMGEFDKAIPRAEDAVERVGEALKMRTEDARPRASTLAEAHYRLATAYKGKGETYPLEEGARELLDLADLHFQKAIDIYEEILRKDPEETGIHYRIAMVYDAIGDLTLAERHLRKHIELDPDEPNTYNFLGYMFVERDMKLEEAFALISKAVEMEPQNGAFRDSLGWIYFKLGDLDRAIEELEKAAELIPDDSEIREHLGEAYLKKGGGDPAGRPYIEKAILEWERALEIRPKNTSLKRRLGNLRTSLDAGNETHRREAEGKE